MPQPKPRPRARAQMVRPAKAQADPMLSGIDSRGKRVLAMQRATAAVRNQSVRMAATKTNRTSVKVREAVLRQAPLLIRGIWKQSGDVVKPWFTVVKPGTKNPHPADQAIQAWARAHRLQQKLRDGLVDAHLHGDGFLEYEYRDSLESTMPPPELSGLENVHVIDPATVELELRPDAGYDLVQSVWTQTVRLHPQRYGVVPNKTLRGYVHGLSTVEVVYHVALSAVKGDQSIGEILYHSGVPREHWEIEDPDEGEIEDLQAKIMDPLFQRGIVTEANTKSKTLNPVTNNPEPYFDWIVLNTAAAIGLPMMMLSGAQAGEVTGSETNIWDYHSDLGLLRTITLRPEVERIITGLTGLTTDEYDILWTSDPVPPSLQASLARERATAMSLYKSAGLTVEAAAREAGITIDPKKDIRDDAGMLPPDAAPDMDTDMDNETEPDEPPAREDRRARRRA